MVKTKLASVLNKKHLRSSFLVAELGVSKQAVSSWCQGHTKPSDKHKQRIANLLGVSVQELFFDEGEK